MPGSIASGGRYDRLVGSLGGLDLPACGGSLGIERILALIAEDQPMSDGLDVAITVIDQARPEVIAIASASALRDAGWRTGTYLGASRKLSKQLKWAADRGARYSLIYGADERAAGQVTLRDMVTGEQTRAPIADVALVLGQRETRLNSAARTTPAAPGWCAGIVVRPNSVWSHSTSFTVRREARRRSSMSRHRSP